MEWILIGIAIAIGFYLAPLILTIVGGVIFGIVAILKGIFGDRR